jgi:cytochrome P450
MTTAINAHLQQRVPPGPRGHFVWGNLREVQREPLHFYIKNWRRYGDIIRFRSFGNYHWYFFARPEHVEYILRVNAQNYPKGVLIRELKHLVGEGLLTSEGETWLKNRRLAQPGFHRKRLQTFGQNMTGAAEVLAERWQPFARDRQPFDVMRDMMGVTLQIVAQSLFSADASGDVETVGHALDTVLEETNYRMLHLFQPPLEMPTRRNRRFVRARGTLDRIVYRIIDDRLRTQADTDDLLSMLVHARDEDTGERMNRRELRDEVMTLYLAGHETTAMTLTWTWYLLAQNPDVERNLHDELAGVLGGRTPTIDDLPKLPYTRMVIDEVLRLYPPAWSVARQAIDDDEIAGYLLPKGAPVTAVQYITHRHPEFWSDPERFDPERFAPQRSAGRPKFAYFPFGGGPRLCIGNNFALMEAQLILATLAQRYRVRVVSGHPVVPEPLLTLRLRHGVQVTLEKR